MKNLKEDGFDYDLTPVGEKHFLEQPSLEETLASVSEILDLLREVGVDPYDKPELLSVIRDKINSLLNLFAVKDIEGELFELSFPFRIISKQNLLTGYNSELVAESITKIREIIKK